MKYQHTFHVDAPISAVFDFHQQPAALQAITPPPLRVRLDPGPLRLGEGDEMAFVLLLGLLPIRWQARIQDVTPTGFTDCQIAGPFSMWEHRHIFTQHGTGTLITDQIQASFKPGFLPGMVGRMMWLGLPVLFAFRGWKTRRILSSSRPVRRSLIQADRG